MLNTSLHNPNVKHKVRESRERVRISRLCLSIFLLALLQQLISLYLFFQPTVEQFISMNRDINDGKDLPVDMLRVS